MSSLLWPLAVLSLLLSATSYAEDTAVRQTMDEAWWTGPLLAASASTLPHGHWLVEPYVFDVITYGRHDADGNRLSVPHQNDFGSQSYILYGVTDRISAGVIPRFAYEKTLNGPNSSGIEVGDVTLQAQYRLTQFREGSWIPTLSFVVGETLPTGKYDKLDQHPGDGFGAGVYNTALSLYTQSYFWLKNGRILRTRLDLTYSFSTRASLRDTSVYGTTSGFSGHAQPGDTLTIDSSWEYSATRNWVLAFDVVYEHDSSTRVSGAYTNAALSPPAYASPSPPSGSSTSVSAYSASSGPGWSLGFAPAIEYNWNARIGVIAGTRIIPIGRNAGISITPVAAINMVF